MPDRIIVGDLPLSASNPMPASLPAAETHIGETGSPADVLNVTPVCDTAIYAAGDVLFDTTAIVGALRTSGGKAKIVSVTVLDEDDQAAATLDLYFFRRTSVWEPSTSPRRSRTPTAASYRGMSLSRLRIGRMSAVPRSRASGM